MSDDTRKEPNWGIVIAAFFSALVVGGVGFGGCGMMVSVSLVEKKSRDMQRGWVLQPVVVAARALTEGQVLVFEDLSSRPIPEQLVTASSIIPEDASKLVGRRVLVPVMEGDPLLWPQLPDPKDSLIFVAAHLIKGGAEVTEADLRAIAAPPELLTASFVRPRERPKLAGRRVVIPLKEGDPVLWSHFAP